MMQRFFFSLRGKLLVGAILPALIMVVLVGAVFLERYRYDLEVSFQDHSRAVARQLGPATEIALFSGSHDGLQRLLNATLQSDKAIQSITILDHQGQILAQAGTPQQTYDPPGETQRGDLTIVVEPIMQVALALDDALTLGGIPPPPGPALVGHAVIHLSRAELAAREGEMIRIMLWILFAGLLLASWLSIRIADGVLARLDAAATELRRQKEIAETLAHTDTLTGLANRRAFDETALQEIERAKRYGTTLALVMADTGRNRVEAG